MSRVLILIPATTYRADALLGAAARLGVDVVVGTNRQQALESIPGTATLTLDFEDQDASLRAITARHAEQPLTAILGPDDETALLAATAAAYLELAGNPPAAVITARDKFRLRQQLAASNIPGPEFWSVTPADIEQLAHQVPYPCVVKPTFLSASRGVIRADSPDELVRAADRIVRLFDQPDVRERGPAEDRRLLIESYLPGVEVAIEGLLVDGTMRLLAIFDKPDPLEGPFFEETLYTTPSRLPEREQRAAVDTTEAAIAALGLTHGPIHAELRIHEGAAMLLEVAPRSIGGRCGAVLRFGAEISLEELVMRAALGYDVHGLARESSAAGVMMIPIPRAGTLRCVEGLAAARSVKGIDEVKISILRGQAVVPLPEGNRYLGFIFARAAEPSDVEAALRCAHAQLRFAID